jgi:hypothetical protein
MTVPLVEGGTAGGGSRGRPGHLTESRHRPRRLTLALIEAHRAERGTDRMTPSGTGFVTVDFYAEERSD